MHSLTKKITAFCTLNIMMVCQISAAENSRQIGRHSHYRSQFPHSGLFLAFKQWWATPSQEKPSQKKDTPRIGHIVTHAVLDLPFPLERENAS